VFKVRSKSLPDLQNES